MISWHFKSVFWEQQVLILDDLIEILHFTLDPDPNQIRILITRFIRNIFQSLKWCG